MESEISEIPYHHLCCDVTGAYSSMALGWGGALCGATMRRKNLDFVFLYESEVEFSKFIDDSAFWTYCDLYWL